MAMMTPPSIRALDASSEAARPLWQAANQDLLHETNFKQSELCADFAPAVSARCDLFGKTVQISPIELVKRHCTERYGMVTEGIYAPTRSRIDVSYGRPAQFLGVFQGGGRSASRTAI